MVACKAVGLDLPLAGLMDHAVVAGCDVVVADSGSVLADTGVTPDIAAVGQDSFAVRQAAAGHNSAVVVDIAAVGLQENMVGQAVVADTAAGTVDQGELDLAGHTPAVAEAEHLAARRRVAVVRKHQHPQRSVKLPPTFAARTA